MSDRRLRRLRRPSWIIGVALVILVSGCAGRSPLPGTLPGASFHWFHATRPPAGWTVRTLPAGAGRLAVPPGWAALTADQGSAAAGLSRAGLVTAYLNATPRQGSETLDNWSTFRIHHLIEEDARSAHLDTAATGLHFSHGGGSCVIDDYLTRIADHHYREIACLVVVGRAASVVVAAALATDWPTRRAVLEQAIDSYRT